MEPPLEREGSRYLAPRTTGRLTTADVATRTRGIQPNSEVKREQIEELRRWAREHLAADAVRDEPAAGGRHMEF